jgi:hypothetical protein
MGYDDESPFGGTLFDQFNSRDGALDAITASLLGPAVLKANSPFISVTGGDIPGAGRNSGTAQIAPLPVARPRTTSEALLAEFYSRRTVSTTFPSCRNPNKARASVAVIRRMSA